MNKVAILQLTTGTTIRDLVTQMADAELDLVACDLPRMKIPGVLMVALMPQQLAEIVRPLLQREFESFYGRVGEDS